MDPPALDETYARGVHGAFPVEHPALEEGEERGDGSSDDLGATFAAKANCGHGKIAARKRRRRRKTRNRLNGKDLRLARRTSKILTHYRDFLLEHEMNSPAHAPSEDLPDDGLRESHYYEHEANTPKTSNQGGEEAACLLREFSRRDAGGHPKHVAVPDVPLGSNDDGPVEKDYETSAALDVPLGSNDDNPLERDYETSVLHSKRVKYGILMSFAVPTIIAAAIVACARGSYEGTMPARENASGWHNEAGYLLEREDRDGAGSLRHHSAVVPWKTAPRNGGSEDASEKETGLEQIGGEAAANVASRDVEVESAPAADVDPAADFDLERLLHRKFKPLWLGPGEGWTGGSHDEATQFCQSIRGKELCPYSAMCPRGPGKNVMAGRRPVDFSSQGEQYAPIYGRANRWIMVGRRDGDASTTCMSHEQLEKGPPRWGSNGDRAEVKSHIMCCSVPTQGV